VPTATPFPVSVLSDESRLFAGADGNLRITLTRKIHLGEVLQFRANTTEGIPGVWQFEKENSLADFVVFQVKLNNSAYGDWNYVLQIGAVTLTTKSGKMLSLVNSDLRSHTVDQVIEDVVDSEFRYFWGTETLSSGFSRTVTLIFELPRGEAIDKFVWNSGSSITLNVSERLSDGETPVATLEERSFSDRPDDIDSDLPQIHLVYLLASDSDDRDRDTSGALENSVTAINKWFGEQSGGRTLRFDTYLGAPDITFIQLDKDGFQVLREDRTPWRLIQFELLTRELSKPGWVYAIYYDGLSESGICGRGGSTDDRRIAVAHFGRGCPADLAGSDLKLGKVDEVMVHEILHAMGAVSDCALHFDDDDARGHVTGPADDIMINSVTSMPARLDVGRDDYFDHNIADCFDVADSPLIIPAP